VRDLAGLYQLSISAYLIYIPQCLHPKHLDQSTVKCTCPDPNYVLGMTTLSVYSTCWRHVMHTQTWASYTAVYRLCSLSMYSNHSSLYIYSITCKSQPSIYYNLLPAGTLYPTKP